jgi:hypothetical protein
LFGSWWERRDRGHPVDEGIPEDTRTVAEAVATSAADEPHVDELAMVRADDNGAVEILHVAQAKVQGRQEEMASIPTAAVV